MSPDPKILDVEFTAVTRWWHDPKMLFFVVHRGVLLLAVIIGITASAITSALHH